MDVSDYGLSGLQDRGLDLRSAADVRRWYRRQWTGIAAALGFAQSLERQYVASSSVSVSGENQTALNAFSDAFAANASDAQARVQSTVLASVLARGGQRGELWRTIDDVATLPGGACYPAAGGELHRAFFPDTAPGYFGEGWPGPPPRAESACGWETPLVLHLGTFPWIYSGRLDGAGPGLRWALEPARLGLGVVASLLDPATNLQQDARQVAVICRTFSSHTLALVRNLPVVPAPGTWSATGTPRLRVGQVFVRDGEVLVHQSSQHLAGLDGPRGRLSVLAYNYCMARFAAFFALRSAAIDALPTLPLHVQQAARSSSDPVLRHYSEQAMRR